MKKLYLCRHAKSSWDDIYLNDSERPLNKRGEHDAPLMGDVLSKQNIKPDLMITSPAKRAHRTANIIAERIGYPIDKIIIQKQIYLADEDRLLALIQTTSSEVAQLMLFGHNPTITMLASSLTNHIINNVPTTGIVCIAFPCLNWQSIAKGKGELVFFDFPKNHG